MQYDIFNGDADGIISLVQMRLAVPKTSQLITGVKRDISLLKQVNAQADDELLVLDISMEKNIEALRSALAHGASVTYIDHHRAGKIPQHPLLTVHVDTAADTCTALIVDKLLNGKYRDWAIAAAYGDNMIAVADALAEQRGLSDADSVFLCELGTLVNYNGYGAHLDDLHFSPAKLFQALVKYESPFMLRDDKTSPFYQLRAAYQADMANVAAQQPTHDDETLLIFTLPDEPWAKRVSGVLGNDLANQHPSRVIAVVTHNADGSLMVSLRAPLANRQGAGEICSSFATGGGREAAAGINALPVSDLSQFISTVITYYRQ
ncbi:DHH family phosphoesterase [Shewanella avicenniae]|uniref:DHH family phosphoesterase n=1 Tax=Shewanella avicenniae TaxID=2814294 RepID=A0ABX7QVI0_9GAMM|nr:DHH family phosphoesterase [Shewanella avicenniae]QSX35507.1 DHH family phosphoesterase [Shewanella avicenniae]